MIRGHGSSSRQSSDAWDVHRLEPWPMTRSHEKSSPNAVDLEDYRWLLGQEGEGWLRRVEEDERDVVALTAALRKELSASRSHLVLEQRDLRRRGRRKFAEADRMFFSQIGLEQATDQVVAGYKARRFPERAARMDLCCGIGGDLLSLAAGGPTLGVDRDRITALLAAENLRRTGRIVSSVVVADVERLAWCPDVIWHLDPDRRQQGRRSVQPRWHQPDEATITEFLARAPHAAVKLAPATKIPPGWETRAEWEWIGRDRQCRQLVGWFGNLTESPGQRRSTVLRVGALNAEPEITSLTGSAKEPMDLAKRVGRYVFEPDPVVSLAGLTGVLARRHQLETLGPDGLYLTGDRPALDAAFSPFEVEAELPFDRKRVKRLLAERGIGSLEIKTRGVDLDPQQLRRQLVTEGPNSAVLILTHFDGSLVAILAHRIE